MASFVLSFFPLDVWNEIWDLIESVSEGLLTYSYNEINDTKGPENIICSMMMYRKALYTA